MRIAKQIKVIHSMGKSLDRQARQFKIMARKMAALIQWPPEETFIPAGGDCVCVDCGLPFFDHPEKDGLNLICDGHLVKL